MKARLIKDSVSYKLKFYSDEDMMSCALGLLSLKNCQAIELDYDLDELAVEFAKTKSSHPTFQNTHKRDFIEGFQKALELMGDKKFSEKDLKRMCSISFNFYKRNDLSDSELEKEWDNWLKNTIQSLQQNEWDVEIEMEEVAIGDKYTPEPKLKLDAEGCLILKRAK